MRKTLVGFILVTIILLFLSGISYAYENVPIKNCQSSLEVIIEVNRTGRIFHIEIYLINNGDEQITILIPNLPGGGFVIHDQGRMVYYTPKIFFPMVWYLTLDSGEMVEMYKETWKGVNDYGQMLPSGDYSAIGFVFVESEIIFSESINIHLEKAKNINILEFLNHFPLFDRLLSFFDFIFL